MLEDIKKDDFSMLGPIHITLSGMKAMICGDSFEMVKNCSHMCGGVGYASMGGF